MTLTYAAENAGQRPHVSGDGLSTQIGLPVRTDLPAALTFKQLREAVRHRFDPLNALEIEYVFEQWRIEDDDRNVPYGEKHFAFSGPKRFKAQSIIELDGSYVPVSHIWAWDGAVQQSFQCRSNDAYIKVERDNWTDHDIYLNNVGIPVVSPEEDWKRAKPTCSRSWLHLLLFDRRWRWTVLPHLEVVDGAACYVIESKGRERLWLDPTLDFAARLYENRWHGRNLKDDDWPVMNRTAFRDFRLANNGIWLPWRYELVGYNFDRSYDVPFGQPWSTVVSEIRRAAVNEDVPDSLFTLQYPAGTVVRDAVRKRFYRVGENGEEVSMGDWK